MRLISAGSLVRAQPGPRYYFGLRIPDFGKRVDEIPRWSSPFTGSDHAFRSRSRRTSLRYRTFVKAFFGLVLFCFALAPALLGAEGPAPTQAISVPPLPFKHMTLPNGLQVYTVEDHKSPTVAVQVWYHVGSKDDPNGRSGFAHLFEHIMFKSTKNMKSEKIGRAHV